MRRRLSTLACLTLVWLLASPTAAFAHCHQSFTYGPFSVISDCGKAALLAIFTWISATVFFCTLALKNNYFLNELKFTYYYQATGFGEAHDVVGTMASNVGSGVQGHLGNYYQETLPDVVGSSVEWALRAAHLSWPGLRIGWQWANDVAGRIGRFIGFW